MKYSTALILFGLFLCDFSKVCGQVVKSKTYIIHFKNGKFIYKKETFDRKGNLITEIDCFNKKCTQKDVKIHKYNDLNQLIEDSLSTTKWGYNRLIWKKVYTYYDNGKLKSETKINLNCSDNFDEQLTYYYDSMGKISRIMNKHACHNNSYFNYPIYFLYDSDGNKISETGMYHDTNKVFYKHVYCYDKQSNLIRDDYYCLLGRDSVPISSSICSEYNNDGKLISHKKVSFLGTSDSMSYSYYVNGLLKEEMYFPNPKKPIKNWTQNYYNKKNDLKIIQTFIIDNDKKVMKGIKKTIVYTYYWKFGSTIMAWPKN